MPPYDAGMRILITGAGRAIGRATAEVLTQRGHEVVATARRPEVLDDLDVAARLPLDVTDAASVTDTLGSGDGPGAAGELDVVINNAAVSFSGPLEDYPIELFQATLDTNVTGALRVVQAVLPRWRVRGSGVVVNISSVQGRVSTPVEGAYAASKFALEALSETMHYELAHFGIRTCIVEPGYIAPGMLHHVTHAGPDAYEDLHRQWTGIDDQVTGDAGRTSPEVAAGIIADAVEDPATPLRVPIGADAELTLAVRKQLDDAAFESTMRSQLGLTW